MKPLASARIYTSKRSRLYVTVYVWRTQKQIADYCRERYKEQAPANIAGLFLGWTSATPEFGEIHLVGRSITMEVVTHEATHAAIHYARRRGIEIGETETGIASKEEELFCGVVGYLSGAISCFLYKVGLVG